MLWSRSTMISYLAKLNQNPKGRRAQSISTNTIFYPLKLHMHIFLINSIMLSTIQHKAASHFCQATDTPMKFKKLSEWFDLDYDEKVDMMTLDREITSFVSLVGRYVMAVEGMTISRDLSELRCKVLFGCIGVPYDYNIFWSSQKMYTTSFRGV